MMKQPWAQKAKRLDEDLLAAFAAAIKENSDPSLKEFLIMKQSEYTRRIWREETLDSPGALVGKALEQYLLRKP
jgi:hypothetical protein